MKHPDNWSDAELLAHDFDILGRPDVDPGLSRAKPHPETDLRFTQAYNITPPKDLPNRLKVQPYVWCALCQEATHWKGWRAEYVVAGQPVSCLIGQDCARRNGGEVVRRAANDFDARKSRSLALRDRQALLPVLPVVKAALENWNQSPGVAAVMTWRNALRSIAEGLAKDLAAAAALSPPTMMIEVEIRDLAAEERRDRRYSRTRTLDPLYRSEHRVFAKIDGASLYAGPNPNARIRILIDKLDTAHRALRRPSEDQTTKEMREALRLLREVTDGAQELEEIYSGVEKGLSDKAIDQLVAWYNHPGRQRGFLTGGSGMERVGRKLLIRVMYDRSHKIDIPDPAPITRPAILSELEAALLGRSVSKYSTPENEQGTV